MSRWFRFYDDTINDPKVLHLREDMRWHWVAVLCIASKNDGLLPPVADIAIMLRKTKSAVAAIIAGLVNAGLLDKTEHGYEPHNWNGRQYKSDVSTDRVKRFRQQQRNVSSAVSETPPDTEAETEQIDRIADARAKPIFTEGSKALTDALWKALGFASVLDITPQFAGADWRAVEWERAGWTPDIIAAEVARVGPDKPLSYYEKCFASAFAKLSAPLPKVEIREAEIIHGTVQRKSGVAAIAGAWADQLEAAACDSSAPDAGVVLRLPAR